jgi:hypothetical protein
MGHDEPFYSIPLGDKDLIILGRIHAVWAQMDHLLTVALTFVTNANHRHLELIFDRMNTGAKVHKFKEISGLVLIGPAAIAAAEFCKKSGAVLGRRNHLTHGIWVQFSKDGSDDYSPACYFAGDKKGLIFAAELPDIYAKATSLVNLLGSLIDMFSATNEAMRTARCRQICMGFGPPEKHYKGPPGSMYMDLLELGHTRQ